MNEHELRFIELSYRIGTLNEMKKKLNEELQNKAIMLLAKAFDTDMESKQIGMISLLDKWTKEIEDEMVTLDGKIFLKFMQVGYDQMEEKLEEKMNNN